MSICSSPLTHLPLCVVFWPVQRAGGIPGSELSNCAKTTMQTQIQGDIVYQDDCFLCSDKWSLREVCLQVMSLVFCFVFFTVFQMNVHFYLAGMRNFFDVDVSWFYLFIWGLLLFGVLKFYLVFDFCLVF